MEWNKLDATLRKSESLPYFRNALLKVGRPTAKTVFNIHNSIGLKLFTRLRPGLSHLNEHKFKHNSQDCIIHYACVVWRLKPFPIFFCTAIFSEIYVQPSLVNYNQLM